MKEITVVKTRIEKLKDYDWLSYIGDDDDVVFVCNGETVTEAARRWGMTPEAVKAIRDAFNFFAEELISCLNEDLRDLWKHRAG